MDRSKWEYKKLGDICDKGSSNIAQNKIEDISGEDMPGDCPLT